MLTTKESITTVQEIKKRLDMITDMENIKELNDDFLPKIRQVILHINKMEQSNLEIRECIKQFDQGLSLKCNKSTIKQIQQ